MRNLLETFECCAELGRSGPSGGEPACPRAPELMSSHRAQQPVRAAAHCLHTVATTWLCRKADGRPAGHFLDAHGWPAAGSRTPAQKRQMKLGVSMIGLGYHGAAWRHPDVPADGSPSIRHSVEVAQTAERGKLDMVFLARRGRHPRIRRAAGRALPVLELVGRAICTSCPARVLPAGEDAEGGRRQGRRRGAQGRRDAGHPREADAARLRAG